MVLLKTVCATFVAFSFYNPFVVKGDTTDGYLTSFEEIGKVEVVNDSSKNKDNVTEMTDIGEQPVVKKDAHPLENLMNAIIYVESRGNEKAYNKDGDCVGILQITKICVRECNNVLKKIGSEKRYTYADRWNKEKSIEMFYLLQDYYNPQHDIKKAIRLWNKSSSYMQKVLERYKFENKKW